MSNIVLISSILKRLLSSQQLYKTLQPALLSAINLYTSNGCQYHTLTHIIETLLSLEKHKHLAHDLDALSIALLFHDAIYIPKNNDNEMNSALLASKELSSINVNKELIDCVCSLILATTHKKQPVDKDEALIIDIDLLIFASSQERFLKYENQIRAEYSFFPKKDYLEKRIEILNQFLSKKYIYNTQEIRVNNEKTARENIKKLIVKLKNEI